MPLGEPGALILLSAVLGFVGTVIFTLALWALNHRLLPRLVPRAACPGKLTQTLLGLSGIFYLALAIAYCMALKS